MGGYSRVDAPPHSGYTPPTDLVGLDGPPVIAVPHSDETSPLALLSRVAGT
jgi:hypothetical protein